MSIDVNVHVWPGPYDPAGAFEAFGGVLECVATPRHRDADSPPPRFGRVTVFESSFSRVVLDEVVATDAVPEVMAKLAPFKGPRFHFEVASAFDCFLYEGNEPEPWLKPLTVNFYGPEYDWQGHEYKSYGPIRLDFSNTKVFEASRDSGDGVGDLGLAGGDASEGSRIIARPNRNFEAVSGLARRVAERLNPAHLLVCSNLEVHPLTSHIIYHRDWRDYVEDLRLIARLHEHGGVYFCEVKPDEPAFRGPRKSPPDYGYLRELSGRRAEESFLRTLQPMVDAALQSPPVALPSKERVEECLYGSASTEVERLYESYYLSTVAAPFDYIEEPYFRLYESCYDPGRVWPGR
jgi:hypothetical protein